MLPCFHVHLNNRPRPFPKPNLSRRKNLAFPQNSQTTPCENQAPAIRILTKSQHRASSHPSLMLWGGAGGGVEIPRPSIHHHPPQSMLPCSHVRLNIRPRPFPKTELFTGRKNIAFPTKFPQQPSLRKSIPAIRLLSRSHYRASSHPSPMLWLRTRRVSLPPAHQLANISNSCIKPRPYSRRLPGK